MSVFLGIISFWCFPPIVVVMVYWLIPYMRRYLMVDNSLQTSILLCCIPIIGHIMMFALAYDFIGVRKENLVVSGKFQIEKYFNNA